MKRILTFSIIFFFYFNAYSQIAINDDNSQPDPSSMLDIKSTDSGVLVPRLTSNERNLISNVATGLLVYDTDEKAFMFYDGTAWKKVGDDSDSDPANEIQNLTMDTKEISISGGNSVEFSPLGKSWEYPQGLDGTPVFHYDQNLTYTVPVGKTLYITGIFNQTWDNNGIQITGSADMIFPEYNNFIEAPSIFHLPVLPSETKIKSAFTGILIDNSVQITPVIIFWETGLPGSYTVPNNKKLVIKSGFSGPRKLKINGFEVNLGLQTILILPSGTVFSKSTFFNTDKLFTGYLID